MKRDGTIAKHCQRLQSFSVSVHSIHGGPRHPKCEYLLFSIEIYDLDNCTLTGKAFLHSSLRLYPRILRHRQKVDFVCSCHRHHTHPLPRQTPTIRVWNCLYSKSASQICLLKKAFPKLLRHHLLTLLYYHRITTKFHRCLVAIIDPQ